MNLNRRWRCYSAGPSASLGMTKWRRGYWLKVWILLLAGEGGMLYNLAEGPVVWAEIIERIGLWVILKGFF